jgi:hypothetical protein
MTLRNEIFEGLTAAKMGRDLVWDPQRNYAEEMYKIARRENDDYDERKRAREQAIAAGVPGQQGTATAIPVPVMASTAMPGTPAGALNTGVNPGIMRLPSSRMPRNPPGTIVDRWGYADGGKVEEDDVGTARARADAQSVEQGERDFGRKNSSISRAVDTRSSEPRVSPLINIYPGERRKDVPRYADGGMVLRDKQREHLTANTNMRSTVPDLADDSMDGTHNEADGIVQELLAGRTPQAQADIGAGRQQAFETSLPAPGEETWPIQGDVVRENTSDYVRKQQAANQPHGPMASLEDAVPEPSEPGGVAAGTQINARGAGDRARMATMQRNIPSPTDTPSPSPPEERSSKVGRAIAPAVDVARRAFSTEISPEAASINDINGRINALVAERQKVDPGLFQQTTAGERTAAEGRIAEIDGEIAKLQEQKKAASQGVTPPGPSEEAVQEGEGKALQTYPPPYGRADPPPPGDPDNIGQLSLVPRRVNQTPGGKPTPPVAMPGQQGSNNGPATTGNNTPGGAAANSPAPPVGSAGVNRPSTAAKPRPALDTQSRSEAYDPVLDANDPRNSRAVDAGGKAYDPQEIQSLLAGAASVAKSGPAGQPPPVGQGTVSRDNFNAYVQSHSRGGAFSPGEAMLAGMLSDYKMLMKQGRVQHANLMAYGLIQAASIEAASYGRVAGDMLKQGNPQGAIQNLVKGANYLPDGLTFSVGPDGKSLVATNGAGQVTGRQAVSPQQLLAMVSGLSDGSLLWQALQSSVAMLTKPDRNAEGRELTNQLRREQITGAQLRNKKLASGGTGTGVSSIGSQLNALLSGGAARPASATPPTQQGSNDMPVDYDPPDPADPVSYETE